MAIAAAAAMWVLAVAVGIRELARYEITPGDTAAAPTTWPRESRLPRGQGFSLVMFVNGDCPCTRASLDELTAITANARVRPTLILVFDGQRGEMWDRALRIPGIVRIIDDGSEAKRFGAKTSGHAVVFDPHGALRFAGGITGSRGHRGDNVGRKAIERLLAGEAGPANHATFGCALEEAS